MNKLILCSNIDYLIHILIIYVRIHFIINLKYCRNKCYDVKRVVKIVVKKNIILIKILALNLKILY